MKLHGNIFTTQNLSETRKILKIYLPSIFYSKCFNYKNLSFFQEVKNTEIGHLFEHIMLEYLCRIKMSYSCDFVEFEGMTKWDWNKEQRGIFNVFINIGSDEKDLFFNALNMSVALTHIILNNNNTKRRNSELFSNNPFSQLYLNNNLDLKNYLLGFFQPSFEELQ